MDSPSTPSLARVEVFFTQAAWMAARTQGIGASESAALLGLSPWESPLSLYARKLGLIERDPSADAAREERLRLGLLIEPVIAELYQKTTKRTVRRTQGTIEHVPNDGTTGSYYRGPVYRLDRHPEHTFLVASLDAYEYCDEGLMPFDGEQQPLELKNVSDWAGRSWVETQTPPLYYMVQLQHQMAVTGKARGSLAALVGGNHFVYVKDVARDDAFIDGVLLPACAKFWEQLTTQTPPDPDAHAATLEALKRLYPVATPGSSIALPAEALALDTARTEAKMRLGEAQVELDAAENAIKALLADNETGILPNGGIYTYKTQGRKEFVSKATTFRVLRRKGDE